MCSMGRRSLFAYYEDHADGCNDKLSCSGVAVMLGNTALSASSMTQHCIAISTSEAECMTMAHAAKTD